MLLLEKDWDHPGGVINVEWEYPDAPIADFLNGLRLNQVWLDNPELIERRLRRLNGLLMDLRNSGAARRYVPGAALTQTVSAPTGGSMTLVGSAMTRTAVAGTIVETVEQKAARIKAARIAGLAKAREAKKANAGKV